MTSKILIDFPFCLKTKLSFGLMYTSSVDAIFKSSYCAVTLCKNQYFANLYRTNISDHIK